MVSQTLLMCSIALAALASFGVAHGDELSSQDKDFIKAAGSGGMLEVRLGAYASQNAGSDQVKAFGEHMVGDHMKINEQLKTVATQMPIEIPKALNDEDQEVLNRLEGLRGAEFDKAYVAQMVEDHKKDIAAFEKEISDGSDPAIKAFAEKALPILKHHLKMAKELK